MEALDESLPNPWPKAPMVESGLTGPPLTRDFAEFVREELVNRYGANAVLAGGLSVYTTLDLEAQVAAEETLYKPGGYLSDPENPDAALVSIETETGTVTAMSATVKRSPLQLVRKPDDAGHSFSLRAHRPLERA